MYEKRKNNAYDWQATPEQLQSAIYVNSIVVGATFSDFYLGFGRNLGDKGALFQGNALMSPQTAKALLETLTKGILQYEEKYGGIPVV